ncbi:MAG: hypothetical protein HQM13_19165 [SAR324 cluster bacterium]|nr:hypothetical protein [SAR324 cluster bacterium]
MLNLSFLDKLNDDQKKWMTLAIAGMVVADGIIDKRELSDLGVVLSHLGNIEKAQKLMGMLKAKQIPRLPRIKIDDRGLAVQMLLAVTKVGIVDNSLSAKEADYLIYLGAILHFPKDYTQSILKWAKQQAEISRLQMEIVKKGMNIDVEDYELIGDYSMKVNVQQFEF